MDRATWSREVADRNDEQSPVSNSTRSRRRVDGGKEDVLR